MPALASDFRDWTPEEYHRDPCVVPSLSSSIAKLLVTKSPRHAWLAHPQLGDQDQVWTRELSMGAGLHTLILGKGPRPMVVSGYADWRKKAAQTQRREIEEAGNVALLDHQRDQLEAMCDAAKAALSRAGLVLDGRSEQAIEWVDEGVVCRSMLDHLVFDGNDNGDPIYAHSSLVVDLKASNRAHPDDFGRQCYDLGYDIQAHAYVRAVESALPSLAGRVRFVWLVVEMSPPHNAYVVPPGADVEVLGRKRWEMARELWRRCLAENHWPGYAPEFIRMPGWAEAKILEAELS